MVVSAVDAVVVVDKLCVIWFSKDIWFSIKNREDKVHKTQL